MIRRIELAVPRFRPFTGDLSNDNQARSRRAAPLAIEGVRNFREVTVVNVGGLRVRRPPQEDDYVFLRPTQVNWPARVVWSVIPNVQFFWLVDAVTQNHPITGRYVALATGYAASHIAALLALAVLLFQRREIS